MAAAIVVVGVRALSGNVGRALHVVEDAWDVAAQSLYVQRRAGFALASLPDVSIAAARRRAGAGRALLVDIDALDLNGLPEELRGAVEVARLRASLWAREEDWYWHVFDPLGVGFYALFAPTAYCGGMLISQLCRAFREFTFERAGDADRYIGLTRDFSALLRQLQERTAGQAQRGIVMPRPLLELARPLLSRLREEAPVHVASASNRVGESEGPEFSIRLDEVISSDLVPAFDAFVQLIGDAEYAASAPEAVGMAQYPGGREVYAELVRAHTTLSHSPLEVHLKGIERMARIRGEMDALFAEVGFIGSPRQYLHQIGEDPAWRANAPEEIREVFRTYLKRIGPFLDGLFGGSPVAPCDAAPLPEALSEGMTFGFYSAPSQAQAAGLYLFNVRNLSDAPLSNLATLTFHELVPGHHLQMTTQASNDALHPLQRYASINAFSEGWAEYAAALAGELGLYAKPEERFGRLMMDAFLTARLVVDTALNALDWNLADARRYLGENGFASESEVISETIRYSCDMPGQALAYKLGDTFILELREHMRSVLGERFDLRVFHEAVLAPGSLPLPALGAYIERLTERLAAHDGSSFVQTSGHRGGAGV